MSGRKYCALRRTELPPWGWQRNRPHCAVAPHPSETGALSPWSMGRGEKQHSLQTPTTSWGSKAVCHNRAGQARPGGLPTPWWAGSQPGRTGHVGAQQDLANEAPGPSHSSQGQSRGKQKPWTESGPGAARKAEPGQLTGRTEPA